MSLSEQDKEKKIIQGPEKPILGRDSRTGRSWDSTPFEILMWIRSQEAGHYILGDSNHVVKDRS